MDCKTARLLAELRGTRSDELPEEDAAALDDHLTTCPDCARALAAERRLDAPVARAMRAIPVPPGLKSRILDRLATERGAWHRRRFYQVAAAAAAVILAVGLFSWESQKRVIADPNQLLASLDRDAESPEARLNDWLAAQGVAYHPPAAFDPKWLGFYGWAEFQSKKVPLIYYNNPERNVFARVYILRDRDFNLSNLPPAFGGSSIHGFRLELFRDPAQPDKLAYVVVTNGDSLEPLLVRLSST
jgi:anti-sigma factor (TIGR02949 family)